MTELTTYYWLKLCNAVTAASWAYVLFVMVNGEWNNSNDSWCHSQLTPAVRFALYVSAVEFFNAVVGITRSKPWQVFLFASVRLGVELQVSPLVGCWHNTHVLTVTCWAAGDAIRFACMTVADADVYIIKWIRYNVGCLLFPVGAFGEMWMVYTAGTMVSHSSAAYYYAAAALWPIGFVPLYGQLLKQRQKFMATTAAKTQSKIPLKSA